MNENLIKVTIQINFSFLKNSLSLDLGKTVCVHKKNDLFHSKMNENLIKVTILINFWFLKNSLSLYLGFGIIFEAFNLRVKFLN